MFRVLMFEVGINHAYTEPIMKTPYHKLANIIVLAGLVSLLGALPSVSAITQANGGAPLPDAGSSFWLLALGCSGVAIAACKRFKR